MNSSIFQFRWINASCYEIRLPDGRVLMFDPYLDRKDPSFTVDDMTTPDYIFITHVHHDHVMELGDMMHRSDNVKLFCNELTAPLLTRYFDLHFGQVYGFCNNDHLNVDGIDIYPTQGKHSRFLVREKESQEKLLNLAANDCGAENFEELQLYGSTVYTDYLLTLPGNFRLFLCGGDSTYEKPYRTADQEKPFLLIRQASNFKTPEDYANTVARYGAQLILPHHQEHAERRLFMPMPEFVERANKRLAEIARGMTIFNPEQYKWYELEVGIHTVS